MAEGSLGAIPGWGTKNPQATKCGLKKKKKKRYVNMKKKYYLQTHK